MDTNLETQRLMINPQPSIRVFNSINSIIDELEVSYNFFLRLRFCLLLASLFI